MARYSRNSSQAFIHRLRPVEADSFAKKIKEKRLCYFSFLLPLPPPFLYLFLLEAALLILAVLALLPPFGSKSRKQIGQLYENVWENTKPSTTLPSYLIPLLLPFAVELHFLAWKSASLDNKNGKRGRMELVQEMELDV